MVTLNMGVEARLHVLSLKWPLRAEERRALPLQAIEIAISGFFLLVFHISIFVELA